MFGPDYPPPRKLAKDLVEQGFAAPCIGGVLLVGLFGQGPDNPGGGGTENLPPFYLDNSPPTQQWLQFERGYKYPSPSSTSSCSSSTKNTTIFEPPNSQDLLHHPPKVVDLWGIEGEGLDLYLHRSKSLSPQGILKGFISFFMFDNLTTCCLTALCWSSEPPIQLWMCAPRL
jgi:hypothetical protein